VGDSGSVHYVFPPSVALFARKSKLGYRAHSMPGEQRTAIGLTGNKGEVESGTHGEKPAFRKSSADR